NADAVCAFERRLEERGFIVAACIRPASVSRGGEFDPIGARAWAETFLSLPSLPAGTRLREILTGRDLIAGELPDAAGRLSLAEIFATLPVAVIEVKCADSPTRD